MPIKIAGKEVTKVTHEDVLVLPRGEEAIALRAKAIQDFDEFSKICPDPKAPGKLTKNGWALDETDPTYKGSLEKHNERRIGWMVVRSLQEIDWDKVDAEKPKTWELWKDDFLDSGFTTIECNLVLDLVISVNGLNEAKLKEARESFIRGQEAEAKRLASLTTEQENTPSGKHVNVSA